MTTRWALLTDTTLCIGCEECVKACKRTNKLPKDVPRRWKRSIDDLSSSRYATIIRRPGGHFVRSHCQHCLDPACVSACLVGAMQKTPEGAVVYDADRCMGCRYCMLACPFGIPRYEWAAPVPYVRKCTLCYPRLKRGKPPACVEACPERATIFGSREDLLKEAHRRIAAQPARYVDKVFGETEVGGTSVLYVSGIPLEFLATSPQIDRTPLPQLTWAALSKVPPVAVGAAGLMAGAWWVIGRRMQLERAAAQHEAPGDAAEDHADSADEQTPQDEDGQP